MAPELLLLRKSKRCPIGVEPGRPSCCSDVQFDPGPTTIGRRSHNDLVSTTWRSARAARYDPVRQRRVPGDLGSTNANQRSTAIPITKALLQHADTVEIGKYRIRFLSTALPRHQRRLTSTPRIRCSANVYGPGPRRSRSGPPAASLEESPHVRAMVKILSGRQCRPGSLLRW